MNCPIPRAMIRFLATGAGGGLTKKMRAFSGMGSLSKIVERLLHGVGARSRSRHVEIEEISPSPGHASSNQKSNE